VKPPYSTGILPLVALGFLHRRIADPPNRQSRLSAAAPGMQIANARCIQKC
jgi:hypothetical protein